MNVGDLWYLCKTMIIIIHTNTLAVNYDGPTVIYATVNETNHTV